MNDTVPYLVGFHVNYRNMGISEILGEFGGANQSNGHSWGQERDS